MMRLETDDARCLIEGHERIRELEEEALQTSERNHNTGAGFHGCPQDERTMVGPDSGKSGTTELNGIVTIFCGTPRDGRQEKSRGATCVAEFYTHRRRVNRAPVAMPLHAVECRLSVGAHDDGSMATQRRGRPWPDTYPGRPPAEPGNPPPRGAGSRAGRRARQRARLWANWCLPLGPLGGRARSDETTGRGPWTYGRREDFTGAAQRITGGRTNESSRMSRTG